ncbi:unnamed protein product [Scytosiphon promiscuus]
MMLARRKLPANHRGRVAATCCWERWMASNHPSVAGVPAAPALSAAGPLARHDRRRLSSTAGSRVSASLPREKPKHLNHPFGAAWSAGGVRYVSSTGRAAAKVKLAHGAKRETPAIPSFIEIRELASLLRVKPRALFKSLGGYQEKKKHRIVLSGVPYAFPNLGSVVVPFQDVQAVAKVLGKEIRFLDIDKKPHRAALATSASESRGASCSWEEGRADGQGRRPVVVLLGHFNHGKTTILDALLGPGSGIAEREAGGITQEIRARTVSLETTSTPGEEDQAGNETKSSPSSSSSLATVATFLDTPGQEIFYRMRTNGARVADAVVLVVSAVDGICLQTSESIGCAEELGLPAVVVLNKIDLLPDEVATQRVKDLSTEVREFVAIQSAQVIPLSARTGYGLDNLRTSLAAALGHNSTAVGNPTPGMGNPDSIEPGPSQKQPAAGYQSPTVDDREAVTPTAGTAGVSVPTGDAEARGDGPEVEVVMAEAPEDAATATVLDYVSSAKTGKVLLVLVDRGVLRPGDSFVSGMLWGVVRSLYDEEGDKLLDHAGPGVAAKVVVVARTRVSNAPLGEPFRVLTKEAAEKVALVRTLAGTMDNFIDHYRLERDFSHLLTEEREDEEEEEGDEETNDVYRPDAHGEHGGPSDTTFRATDGMDGRSVGSPSPPGQTTTTPASEWPKPRLAYSNPAEDDDLAPEDMPVTIVVKADSANTLASVIDALGDWGDVQSPERSDPGDFLGAGPGDEAGEAPAGSGDRRRDGGSPGAVQHGWQDWGEHDLQHKQRRRLVVSVARAGVGAVTSSDVRLARDCECPVFAHNVKADASASRELKRVGGGVVPALPEGAVNPGDASVDVGVGGLEGYIGRAGEGKECVVVSETVGELLGEIERFVLRVR